MGGGVPRQLPLFKQGDKGDGNLLCSHTAVHAFRGRKCAFVSASTGFVKKASFVAASSP